MFVNYRQVYYTGWLESVTYYVIDLLKHLLAVALSQLMCCLPHVVCRSMAHTFIERTKVVVLHVLNIPPVSARESRNKRRDECVINRIYV